MPETSTPPLGISSRPVGHMIMGLEKWPVRKCARDEGVSGEACLLVHAERPQRASELCMLLCGLSFEESNMSGIW